MGSLLLRWFVWLRIDDVKQSHFTIYLRMDHYNVISGRIHATFHGAMSPVDEFIDLSCQLLLITHTEIA